MADTIVHSEADERQMLEAISKWIKTKVAPVALKLELAARTPYAPLAAGGRRRVASGGACASARAQQRGASPVVNRLQ